MAFINNHTSSAAKTELDLFAVPPTQNSIENGSMQCYRPISSLSENSAPIEFLVSGGGDEYIDLAHTAIHIVAEITSAKMDEDDRAISCANNLLHSLFSQVDIFLNQKCVTPPNHYSYRAYIENLLNYSEDAKKSHLQSVFWYDDTKRSTIVTAGGKIEMYGHLHCDIFNQNKFLINGVEMKVKLSRTKRPFYMMCVSTHADIKIIDANLYVRKAKINPSILIAHHRALSVATVKYPITRVEIKTFSVGKDLKSKSIDNLYLGQLPKRVVVGFVDNDAMNGISTKDPFKFEHFNHNFLSLYVDSIQIPTVPLTPDFSNNLYMRSYHTLFSGTGIHFDDDGNGISYENYKNGNALSVFDLTADLSSHQSHWSIIKSGTLRLEVRFEKVLENAISIVVFSEFDNLVEIDKNRNVIVDYSS